MINPEIILSSSINNKGVISNTKLHLMDDSGDPTEVRVRSSLIQRTTYDIRELTL